MSTTSSNIWVIVHIFDNDKSALIWSPSTQQSRCLQADQISGQDLVLGTWLCISQKTGEISKTDSTCNFRVVNGTLQIRAPVVFFSSSKLLIGLGYAPGFGRVGCFDKEMVFEKDQIYMAWITYEKYSTDEHLRGQMTKYNVEWVVASQPILPVLKSKIDEFLQANNLNSMQSVNGVVVSKDNETGSIYNPKHGVCDYQLTNKTAFNVGSFVHFIPIENSFGWMTAHNISKNASLAEGISLSSCEPKLKLSIKNWEHNAEKGVIDVPNWDLQLHLAKNMPEDCEKVQQYDYSQPISVVYDNEDQRFTLSNGIPVIQSQEKVTEVLSEAEEHLNFFTPLTLGPKLVKEKTDKLETNDDERAQEAVQNQTVQKKATPSNFGRVIECIETDAVVVYLRTNDVCLFALKIDLPYRKFTVAKSRFKEDPHLGDWFRVSLPDSKIIAKLYRPTLKTMPLNSQLITLYTRIKVVEAFVNEDDPDEICGYSDDLGPIIDNENCLKKSQLGKTINVWVLSNAPTNGAHWRIFSKNPKPPRRSTQLKSSERSNCSKRAVQKCSTVEKQNKEERDNASGIAVSDVDKGQPNCFYDLLASEQKSLKKTTAPNVNAKIAECDHGKEKVGIRVTENKASRSAIGAAEENVENSADSSTNTTQSHISLQGKNSDDRPLGSNHNEGIKVNAVVTFVSPTSVSFHAVRSKLTDPSIRVNITEFGDNNIPCIGDWYHLTMDSEKDCSGGFQLKDPVLRTQVDKGKFLMIKTKVRVKRLPKIGPNYSSVCGYSEDLGLILDSTEWLRPHQAHRTIEVWVEHCKPKDGSSWCIFNQHLYRQ
uniref:Telomeric single stranded DNA binding POT1/Cdc13 domain-containing protein n=1 Tax=Ditylenchus dipsaci TaxID=166011 RepID=A0A915CWH7_9BILA